MFVFVVPFSPLFSGRHSGGRGVEGGRVGEGGEVRGRGGRCDSLFTSSSSFGATKYYLHKASF